MFILIVAKTICCDCGEELDLDFSDCCAKEDEAVVYIQCEACFYKDKEGLDLPF